jgi:hypothetical protein
MKIRTSFITNSSSSSFIIAFKDLNKVMNLKTQEVLNLDENSSSYLKMAWNIYKSLMSRVFKGNENTSVKIIKCEEDVKEYFIKHYWYNSLEDIFNNVESSKDEYINYINYLNNGFTIVVFDTDYHEEWLVDFLSNIADGDDIILIENW